MNPTPYFRLARDYGLSLSGLWVLWLLSREDEQTMTTLAQAIGVTKAAFTGIAASLEAAGMIERHPLRSDGRRIAIRLTDEAREAMTLAQIASRG